MPYLPALCVHRYGLRDPVTHTGPTRLLRKKLNATTHPLTLLAPVPFVRRLDALLPRCCSLRTTRVKTVHRY